MRQEMFRADWDSALFIHFAIDPARLADQVPFELDVRDGRAFVSLVAFTQRRLRPARGGRLAAVLSAPLAQHEFLNLRTYVRVDGRPAICFLSEWIPNRLAVLIGPRLYGLPYHWARLRYRHAPPALSGRVIAPGGVIAYRAAVESGRAYAPAVEGSLDHFLLERYVAVTHRRGVSRRFEVDHEPWLQQGVQVRLAERSLLDSLGEWTGGLERIGANYSPGVRNVGISPPKRVGGQKPFRSRKKTAANTTTPVPISAASQAWPWISGML